MHRCLSHRVAIILMATLAFAAPIESTTATTYSRCTWKHTHEKMKLAQCGHVDSVPAGSPVTGPTVGDYNPAASFDESEIATAHFKAGHAETLSMTKSHHLAIMKHGGTQWMQCTTVPQGSGYFGGHNSYCSKKLLWSAIPPGKRVIGFGVKGDATESPELPRELGGEYIGGGPKEKRSSDPQLPISDQDATELNFGRYNYINGTTYLLKFTFKRHYKVVAWSDILMGSYVFNPGFKSTDDEPEASNPWVNHCAHASCLNCEQKECKGIFDDTLPGSKTERICEERDEQRMCSRWEQRENDKEGQARLCEMGKREFCRKR